MYLSNLVCAKNLLPNKSARFRTYKTNLVSTCAKFVTTLKPPIEYSPSLCVYTHNKKNYTFHHNSFDL